jgi:hypothetical protein
VVVGRETGGVGGAKPMAASQGMDFRKRLREKGRAGMSVL